MKTAEDAERPTVLCVLSVLCGGGLILNSLDFLEAGDQFLGEALF
jgi:hypothetical protein